MQKTLSIIIPCYNEEDSLLNLKNRLYPVLEKIKKNYKIQLIFVDDGSKDKTNELLHKYFKSKPTILVKILKHDVNKNLGAAIRTGLSAVLGETIAMMDSDCTYDPEGLILLLDTFEETGADIVTASPYHPKGGVEGVPAYRLFLSRAISLIYVFLTFRRLYTFTSMFRIYKKEILTSNKFYANNFIAVTELMIYPLLKKAKVIEVPMVLHSRQFGVSKMKVVNTIVSHLKFIFRVIRMKLGV